MTAKQILATYVHPATRILYMCPGVQNVSGHKCGVFQFSCITEKILDLQKKLYLCVQRSDEAGHRALLH